MPRKKQRYRHIPNRFKVFPNGPEPEILDRADLSVRALVFWALEQARRAARSHAIDFLETAIRKLTPRLVAMANSDNAEDRQEGQWLIQEMQSAMATLKAFQQLDEKAAPVVGPLGTLETDIPAVRNEAPLTAAQRVRAGPWWVHANWPPWKHPPEGDRPRRRTTGSTAAKSL